MPVLAYFYYLHTDLIISISSVVMFFLYVDVLHVIGLREQYLGAAVAASGRSKAVRHARPVEILKPFAA